MRFASDSELANWNQLIALNPDGGNFFQSKQFAEAKQANRWQPLFIKDDILTVLILSRPVTSLGNFWYLPKGPGIKDTKQLQKLLPALAKFAKQHHVFAIRMEPELLESPNNTKSLAKLGLQKARPVQAANTVIVDISQSLDTIIAGFSSKTSVNIG
jgi:lipid II:glycine glycyltransferase (peptidoglycan interpeptide bridge formation enzyme)